MSNNLEEIKVNVPSQDEINNRSIRIGAFQVKQELVEDALMAEAFGIMKFVPVRCELAYGGMFHMIGFSHMFDEIDFGMPAPPYDIQIAVNKETGEFDHVEVKRQ